MGASTSLNPQGLFRPVKGLLYLYLGTDTGKGKAKNRNWGNLIV